jgi:hypothetical protein
MTWRSSGRAKRAPGAFLALVFGRFGRVDEAAGANFDPGTTSLPYRSMRRPSRASPAKVRAEQLV